MNDALRTIVEAIRQRNEWSEKQAADYIGIPQQTLNGFMAGDNDLTLKSFSKMLDPAIAFELHGWLREHLEEAALKEAARLGALPRGPRRRGRPPKK